LGAAICLGATSARAEAGPVRLAVEAAGPREALRLVFENTGAADELIYVDHRLAQVELRAGRRVVGRCAAPADATPREPDERRFVRLRPGERAEEPLGLRFHCFGAALGRLGAATEARVAYRSRFGTDALGRPARTEPLGPVDVTLALAPVAVPAPLPDGSAAVVVAPPPDVPVALVRVGPPPDVAVGDDVAVTLELRGPPRGRLLVAVRPDAFSFHIDTPTGALVDCQLPAARITPLAESYERLVRRQVAFDVSRICPRGAFNEAGVYRVTPVLRAVYDGRDVGVAAWTGRVEGAAFEVRVRRAGRGAADPVETVVRDPAALAGAGEAAGVEGAGNAR
jgi:hypothetical protein